MISTLAACGLAATTAVSLLGWWSATRAYNTIADRYDAALTDLWSPEEVAGFAGRCAWHDFVSTDSVPPMVGEHHADAFRAGFAAEQAIEDEICAGLAVRLRETAHRA